MRATFPESVLLGSEDGLVGEYALIFKSGGKQSINQQTIF
jgi:hypothetical protein